MVQLDLLPILLTLSISATIAAITAWFLLHARSYPAPRQVDDRPPEHDHAVFLFENEDLIDATDRGFRLMNDMAAGEMDRTALVDHLSERFPGLVGALERIRDNRKLSLNSVGAGDTAVLRAEQMGGLVRLELTERSLDHTGSAPVETSPDTALVDDLPVLLWSTDAENNVVWANRSFRRLAARIGSPLPKDGVGVNNIFAALHGQDMSEPVSISIDAPDGDTPLLFNVSKVAGNRSAFCAVEDRRPHLTDQLNRHFTQTLTRTFSSLPIGIAVFDTRGRLSLFNPALTDMTGLPIEILTSQPTLQAFLDALRDRRMIPEPKNFKAWRERFLSPANLSPDGVYEEAWSLPSGRTYRVTSRRFGDNTLTIQFEDVTSEVALTRHFRSELEMGQAVVNSFSQAIAVFDPNGILSQTNSAYVELWGHDPSITIGDVTGPEAVGIWSEACTDARVFTRIAREIGGAGPKKDWSEQIILADGTPLTVDVKPLPGRALLVGFRTHNSPDLRPAAVPDVTEAI